MNLITHTVFKPLLVGTLLTLIPLAAQGPRPPQGPGHQKGHLFKDANLTETQKSSLEAIHAKHQAALETKRKAETEAQEAFHKAMQNPATTEADLKALFEKTSQARFVLILERRAMMQESLALLSTEQKAQVEKQMAEGPRHEGREGRKGGPRHKGGPDHEGAPHAE